MNDNPKWQIARLDEIERRGRNIPVREHLGMQAFGVNAFTTGDDGTLINEHDEAGSGQQELYLVLDGQATFEIDDARPERELRAVGILEPQLAVADDAGAVQHTAS